MDGRLLLAILVGGALVVIPDPVTTATGLAILGVAFGAKALGAVK